MTDEPQGMNVRKAILAALEAIPGSLDSTMLDMKRKVLRDHLVNFVKDFAQARGVIFEDDDIIPEIDAVLGEMKAIAKARTKTPR